MFSTSKPRTVEAVLSQRWWDRFVTAAEDLGIFEFTFDECDHAQKMRALGVGPERVAWELFSLR